METKDTLSSCSDSDEQDMQLMLKRTKILKGSFLNGLSALKSNFTRKHVQGITKSEFERAFSHIFGKDVDTFTKTFSQNMDTLEQQLTKETIIESNCQNAFRKRLDDKKLQIQECTVQKASDAISEDKAQERCMVSYRLLHSHIKLLSSNDLKGTRTEYGFKRAFATLFGQDLETFIGTMFLNMDQLEKQLNNKEFQETRSMASFRFLEYTQLEIPEFCVILIQHMKSVKKSIDERAHHKREYDIKVNERQIHATEEKVDTSKALDASLVDTKISGTELVEQDTSSRLGNDGHADDTDIKPIYDEEPMTEVQLIAEFNNEGEVDQNAKQCHDTRPLSAKLTDNQTTEL
nr:hypothetical protein [Tanacetum cinerariifolium]